MSFNLKWQTRNKYSFKFSQSKGIGGKIARLLMPIFAAENNLTNRNKKSTWYALEMFLFNCWKAIKLQEQMTEGLEVTCSYSREKKKYQSIARYFNHSSFSSLISIINVAEVIGFITGQRGYKGANDSRLSYFQPTQMMIDFFNENEEVEISVYESDSLKLKNQDKGLIDYVDTEFTNQLRSNISKVNSIYKNNNLSFNTMNSTTTTPPIITLCSQLEIPSLFPVLTATKPFYRIFTYKRVFNEDWSQGGRFYSDFQNLPKHQRAQLLINNNKTVSLDYSGMHLNMLYNLVGLDMSDFHEDPYEGLGVDRKTAKLAMLTILNAKTTNSAIKALSCSINKDKPNELYLSYNEAIQLISNIKIKHSPISDYLCSGEGIRLQNKDSRIAEKIMLHFAEQGKVSIGVHDGFIVQESDINELRYIMERCYKEEMGFACKIKQEY